jgi:hypothetical protein
MSLEDAKDIFTIIGTIIGILVFAKGVLEFMHANAIRRYEKFHQMSVRFDGNAEIQKVCTLLHGVQVASDVPTKQEKEVFICFLEEVYFMVKSRIMKQDLALYTFGYYGQMALSSTQFWQGLDRNEPFYAHFLRFCELAKAYRPESGTPDLTY